MGGGLVSRVLYGPLLAQVVVIRRCNLSCGYCSERDGAGQPVAADVLERRLGKLRELGALTIGFTGGEPTLHPELPRLVRQCRELGFLVTGVITNGFLLSAALIGQLNEAGLQELQISIDGVHDNPTTQKVLDNLERRLEILSERACFHVTISAVLGTCPPNEVLEVIHRVRALGFRPRLLLVHDSHGRLRLDREEAQVFEQIVRRLPGSWIESPAYLGRLAREGTAPYKCRAGSRYLYVDEHGNVAWCSQTRDVWSKPLLEYTAQDLKEQFGSHKPCHAHCTVGCARNASRFDQWRYQERPLPVPLTEAKVRSA